jgi:hypothetical protein
MFVTVRLTAKLVISWSDANTKYRWASRLAVRRTNENVGNLKHAGYIGRDANPRVPTSSPAQSGAFLAATFEAARLATGRSETGLARAALILIARFYFARFHAATALPPPEKAGTVYLSSSPTNSKLRFCSVPLKFGYVLSSKWKMILLSAGLTVYRPKCEMVPCTTALFSSAVPFVRLLDANFGTSFRLSISP